MPRELFVETVTHKYAPKRSKWTIAGSILAHAALLGVIVVVPILSALDNYVIHANKLTLFIPPRPVIQATSATPPKVTSPAPAVNRHAAPITQPLEPVTREIAAPASGPPVPTDPFIIGTTHVGLARPGDATVTSVTSYRPPELKTPEPVRVGGNIKIPARTYYVEPIYPTIALAAKVEGYVILEATVDESGIVRNLRVLKSHPMLDKAAMEAVAKWRYTPTLLNGTAVPIIMTVTVTFALR